MGSEFSADEKADAGDRAVLRSHADTPAPAPEGTRVLRLLTLCSSYFESAIFAAVFRSLLA
jgi:hypothetical protein